MTKSSLYRDGIGSEELDQKWAETYKMDMDNAESFHDIQKIKYTLIGFAIGLSVNIVRTFNKKERRVELDKGYLDENKENSE